MPIIIKQPCDLPRELLKILEFYDRTESRLGHYFSDANCIPGDRGHTELCRLSKHDSLSFSVRQKYLEIGLFEVLVNRELHAREVHVCSILLVKRFLEFGISTTT